MLEGANVLITGGIGRLGGHLWRAVEAAGGTALVTSRNDEKVARFNAQSEAGGFRSRAIAARMESEQEAREVARKVLTQVGTISGLVNNAVAHLPYRAAEDVPWSHWEDAARVGLALPLTLSSEFARVSDRSRLESIVNVASIYGVVAPDFTMYPADRDPSAVYYGATKSAIIGMTRYLAAYWAPKNIRVNAVSPGGIEHDQTKEFLDRYADTVPMRRMVTGEEVSNVICFLLSSRSEGVTGHNIVVDAGRTIW